MKDSDYAKVRMYSELKAAQSHLGEAISYDSEADSGQLMTAIKIVTQLRDKYLEEISIEDES